MHVTPLDHDLANWNAFNHKKAIKPGTKRKHIVWHTQRFQRISFFAYDFTLSYKLNLLHYRFHSLLILTL